MFFGVGFEDDALKKFGNMLSMVGEQAPHAMRRALNRAGDETKTQVIRALTKQTGLQRKTIVKAVKVTRANFDELCYVMRTRGGNISLKYFHAVEKDGGVFAKPRGKEEFYANAFITSGRAPNRFPVKKLNGHVYQNVAGGAWRGKIEKVKSNVYIPKEMVRSETLDAFQSVAKAALDKRLQHELGRLLDL